jgi:UDP-glucose 4-epimerase
LKVLVTGSAGRIGRRVVALLRSRGDTVTGFDRVSLPRDDIGYRDRIMIADARDIADGVLALDSGRAVGQTMNLGPDAPVRFDEAASLLATATGLPIVRVNLPGPTVDYATSNARARELLGFRPRWTFAEMVADARR